MIGVYEWKRFQALFPDLAMKYKSFSIDPHRPHALIIEFTSGPKLYFDCGKGLTDFTLTTDENVINHLRFAKKFKK